MYELCSRHTFELEVPSLPPAVDVFSQYVRSAVSQLPAPVAELMPPITVRQWGGEGEDSVAANHLKHGYIIKCCN